MILAILQARVSSSRFPGKVMESILGRPMLALQIERVLRSVRIGHLVVATSTEGPDDAIEHMCRQIGVACFRGSLDDVLDRFYRAALTLKPSHVVRLTGDCPLVDPAIIDCVIDFCLSGGYDYASNTIEPTFPDGLDVEIFRFSALEAAWTEATLPSAREHVTPFIYGRPERFRIGRYSNAEDLSRMRWTVDEPEDLEVVRSVYELLYPKDPEFRMQDILSLLAGHPGLALANGRFERNEGLRKSLEKDRRHEAAKKLNIRKSLDMQERGKARIPGLSQLFSKRPDLYSYGVWPGYYSRAKGAEVWDLDGNRYIDMSMGGIGANVLGYGDADVDGAVMEAIRKGTSTSLNCAEEVELADLLCAIHPWAEKARFARTGGEAMAVAVRIARAATGRDRVAFCGYHGWHDWYLAANIGTENGLGEHLLPGLEPLGVPKCLKGTSIPFRYNRLDELRSIVEANEGEIAAVVMEPVRNELPVPGFFEGVRSLADRYGAVLIADEISAAFRMNTGGAHLVLGLKPDMAVFSKALGNGYPIAAIIGKGSVMEAAERSFISSTYWTERIGPAAALTTVGKHLNNDVGSHLTRMGRMVQEGWRELFPKHGIPIQVSGLPAMGHFAFEHESGPVLKALFVQAMLGKGFLATTGFYAMFAHDEAHVRAYLDAVEEVLPILVDAIGSGSPEGYLLGRPAASGFRRLN